MTNRKIKQAQTSMRARVVYDASERNYCAACLYLRENGISANKILEMDDEFHDETMPYYRKRADSGVLDVFIKEFLRNVHIEYSELEALMKIRYDSALVKAFPTAASYSIAVESLVDDLVMVLCQLNMSFGYGHIRLKRVLDYIKTYNRDEKADVWEKLKIRYPDPDTLPDIQELRRKNKIETPSFEELKKIKLAIVD